VRSHSVATILSLKYLVMKKSVELPLKQGNERKLLPPAAPKPDHRGRNDVRKSFEMALEKIWPANYRAQEQEKDENSDAGDQDTEEGKYSPTEKPW
jgi:cell division protein FtsN